MIIQGPSTELTLQLEIDIMEADGTALDRDTGFASFFPFSEFLTLQIGFRAQNNKMLKFLYFFPLQQGNKMLTLIRLSKVYSRTKEKLIFIQRRVKEARK